MPQPRVRARLWVALIIRLACHRAATLSSTPESSVLKWARTIRSARPILSQSFYFALFERSTLLASSVTAVCETASFPV